MEIIFQDQIPIAESGAYGKFDMANDGHEFETQGKRTAGCSVSRRLFPGLAGITLASSYVCYLSGLLSLSCTTWSRPGLYPLFLFSCTWLSEISSHKYGEKLLGVPIYAKLFPLSSKD